MVGRHAFTIAHEIDLAVSDLVIHEAVVPIARLDQGHDDLHRLNVDHGQLERSGQIELTVRLWQRVTSIAVSIKPELQLFGGEGPNIRDRASWLSMTGDVLAVDAKVAVIISAIVADFASVEARSRPSAVWVFTIDATVVIIVLTVVATNLGKRSWGHVHRL